MRCMPAQVSAGHSHSAAITVDGQLFIWGSGVSGKLGLGEITKEFECFAPLPTRLRFHNAVKVSCGPASQGILCAML